MATDGLPEENKPNEFSLLKVKDIILMFVLKLGCQELSYIPLGESEIPVEPGRKESSRSENVIVISYESGSLSHRIKVEAEEPCGL